MVSLIYIVFSKKLGNEIMKDICKFWKNIMLANFEMQANVMVAVERAEVVNNELTVRYTNELIFWMSLGNDSRRL